VERAVKQRQRLRAVKDRLKAMHFQGAGMGARESITAWLRKWEPGRAIRAE